jgi:hypothetical protein
VSKKQRWREAKIENSGDRQAERERQSRDRQRQKERQRERQRETEIDRQTEREEIKMCSGHLFDLIKGWTN